MSFRKKRVLAIVLSGIMNLAVGSLYAWSVFSNPLCEELNVASLAIIYTVTNAVGPVAAVCAGFINDKIGPRWLCTIGGILLGLSFLLSGFARSSGMLIFTFAVLGGLGRSTCYACTTSNTLKYFPDKRGVASGILTATYGFSSVIIPLVAEPIIEFAGVFQALIILGIAFLIIFIVGSQFLFKCPDSETLVRELGESVAASTGGKDDKDAKGMLTDLIFYPIFIMVFAGTFMGNMIISSASPISQTMIGMTPAAAAVAVSVLALFNVGGRLIAGAVSDKIGIENTFLASFILSIVGLLLLFFAGIGDTVVFYIGMIAIGLAFGSFMCMMQSIIIAQFGPSHNATNYAILAIGYSLSGVVSPLVASSVVLSTGSYVGSYVVAACAAVFGTALLLVVKAIIRKRNSAAKVG